MKFEKVLIIPLVLISVLLVSIMASCSGSETTTASFKTVIDHLDRSVQVPANPTRVITLHPIATQIVYCLNAQDKLIAMDDLSKKRAWLLKIDPTVKDATVFSTSTPSAEALTAMNPDLIIVGAYDKALVETVSKAGTAIAFDFHLKTTIEAVSLIGKALGKEKEANELIKYINEKEKDITSITSQIPQEQKPKVVYLTYQAAQGSKDYVVNTCGKAAYQQSMLDMVGAINLGADQNVIWFPLSSEQLLAWDPDVLFFRTPVVNMPNLTLEGLRSDPILGNLTAVKNAQFFVMPDGEFSTSVNAPETVIGLLFMAKSLYPDKFKNLSLEKEVKEFFSKWYDYDLTQEEVNSIVYPKYRIKG